MTESREDFEQVCRLTLEDNVVAVASNSPWKTFEDLAAVALESALGTSFQHIPLGGGGQIASTQSGEVHFGVASCANYAPYVESGDVRILVSLRFKATSKLEFKLHGRASHASRAPENGISACDAVMLGYLGIEMLREHVKEDVRIHGIITNGGSSANTVPDFSNAEYGVRANDSAVLEDVVERICNCFRGAALTTGASLEIVSRKTLGCPAGCPGSLFCDASRMMQGTLWALAIS